MGVNSSKKYHQGVCRKEMSMKKISSNIARLETKFSRTTCCIHWSFLSRPSI